MESFKNTLVDKRSFVVLLLTAGMGFSLPVSNEDEAQAGSPCRRRCEPELEHDEDAFRNLTRLLYTQINKRYNKTHSWRHIQQKLAEIQAATPIPLSTYACAQGLDWGFSGRSGSFSQYDTLFSNSPSTWIKKLEEREDDSLTGCEWSFTTPKCTYYPHLFLPVICQADCGSRSKECRCGSACKPQVVVQLPVLKFKCVKGKASWKLVTKRHVPPVYGACDCEAEWEQESMETTGIISGAWVYQKVSCHFSNSFFASIYEGYKTFSISSL